MRSVPPERRRTAAANGSSSPVRPSPLAMVKTVGLGFCAPPALSELPPPQPARTSAMVAADNAACAPRLAVVLRIAGSPRSVYLEATPRPRGAHRGLPATMRSGARVSPDGVARGVVGRWAREAAPPARARLGSRARRRLAGHRELQSCRVAHWRVDSGERRAPGRRLGAGRLRRGRIGAPALEPLRHAPRAPRALPGFSSSSTTRAWARRSSSPSGC